MGCGAEGSRRRAGVAARKRGRLAHHPVEHGVDQLAAGAWAPADPLGQSAGRLREAALGRDPVEHRGRLATPRGRAQPAERAPRHLAQPLGAGGRAQPGGGEHEQRGADARGAARRRGRARRRARRRTRRAARIAAKASAGAERLAVGARQRPRPRPASAATAARKRPLRASEQQRERNGRTEGDRPRVESRGCGGLGRRFSDVSPPTGPVGLPSVLSFVEPVPRPQPAPVHQHLHRARERRPGQQAHDRQHHRVRRPHLDARPGGRWRRRCRRRRRARPRSPR